MTPEQLAALYEEIFGEALPESVASLTREELEERIRQHERGLARIATREAFAEDAEHDPDRNERIGLLRDGKAALLALRAALAEHENEDEAFEAEQAEILAEAGISLDSEPAEGDAADGDAPETLAAEAGADDEDADDEDDEGGDDEGDDAVTASGQRVYTTPARPPAVPRRNQPITVGDGLTLVASAGHERIREGEALDREALSHLTMATLRRVSVRQSGVREKVVIASAFWGDEYPEERRLDDNQANTQRRLDAVRGRHALQANETGWVDGVEPILAAGGWCAPNTIRYDIDALGTTSRPVRDALTSFLATRGGIQFIPDMSIAGTDVTGAITVITAEEDEEGGASAEKECLVIDCPEFSDVRADIIATCLQAGNLMERAYPELISAWQDLVGVAAARTADSKLLDAISDDAQTKNTTAIKVYGAFSSVVYAYARAAAGYRSRHRLEETAVLRALAPAWLADLLVVDLVNRPFQGFEATRAGVAALIQRYTNIAITWYLDSPTPTTVNGVAQASQIFDAQSDDASLDDFPANAISYLYPEGGILHVDQGELNLGVVRDSVLNRTNDVQFFAEFFENATVTAAEVLEITQALCPTGESGPMSSESDMESAFTCV